MSSKIHISWTDESTDETSFKIFRSPFASLANATEISSVVFNGSWSASNATLLTQNSAPSSTGETFKIEFVEVHGGTFYYGVSSLNSDGGSIRIASNSIDLIGIPLPVDNVESSIISDVTDSVPASPESVSVIIVEDQPSTTMPPITTPVPMPVPPSSVSIEKVSEMPTTTLAPTTQAPTTQAPTTQAPTTQAPTTQAPTTQAPTTTLAPTFVADPNFNFPADFDSQIGAHKVILLEAWTSTSTIYNIGYIFQTTGKKSANDSVRAEDPLNPRELPYTSEISNRESGAWRWFNVSDRGTTWDFAKEEITTTQAPTTTLAPTTQAPTTTLAPTTQAPTTTLAPTTSDPFVSHSFDLTGSAVEAIPSHTYFGYTKSGIDYFDSFVKINNTSEDYYSSSWGAIKFIDGKWRLFNMYQDPMVAGDELLIISNSVNLLSPVANVSVTTTSGTFSHD